MTTYHFYVPTLNTFYSYNPFEGSLEWCLRAVTSSPFISENLTCATWYFYALPYISTEKLLKQVKHPLFCTWDIWLLLEIKKSLAISLWSQNYVIYYVIWKYKSLLLLQKIIFTNQPHNVSNFQNNFCTNNFQKAHDMCTKFPMKYPLFKLQHAVSCLKCKCKFKINKMCLM